MVKDVRKNILTYINIILITFYNLTIWLQVFMDKLRVKI